ncbi:MAG: porin family protein [Desulfuromonadaceae bacterium]|nr:porin family protein [Desulfuromonadaceae bacterium]
MFRQVKILGAIISAMALFAGTSALAGHKVGKLSLTPMLGGYVFEGNQDQKNAPAATLALGFNYTPHWGTEFALSYVDSENKTGRKGDIDVGQIRWDVLYHFRPDKVLIPYLAAGLGSLITNPDRGDTDADFMVNYGVGLKFFVTENLALRGDVRHVYEVDDKFNNLIYSAGLVFQIAP